LSAAQALAREAAWNFDCAPGAPFRFHSAVARLSARAASLEAAHLAHQVFGAIGVMLEGPVYPISRRIRQLASAPPEPDAARRAMLDQIGLVTR
jgi:alkylation response protein AidB-like acyl-CoA dehydrogenase